MKNKVRTKELFANEIEILRKRVAELENVAGQTNNPDYPGAGEGDYRLRMKKSIEDNPAQNPPEALKKSEEKYRIIVESSLQAIFVVQDLRLIFLSQSAVYMSGYSEEILTSSPLSKFIHPDDYNMVIGNHIKRLKGEYAPRIYSYRFIKEDGSIKWVETNSVLIQWNGRDAILNFLNDITDRKQTEVALLESEERFKSIVSTSQEWIWTINPEGVHTFSNTAIKNILGYDPDEIVGKDYRHLLHEDDIQKAGEIMERCINQKTGWPNLILRWKHKDGNYRYLESNAVPILDSAGILKGFHGSDRDITDRMQSEEARRESEEQLRILSQNLTNGMLYQMNTGPDGCQRVFTYLSPAVEKLHGLKAEDVIQNPSLIYEQIDEKYRTLMETSEAHAVASMSKFDIDVPIRLSSGNIRWINITSSPRKPSNGNMIWDGIELDITERKRAEEERNILQERLQRTEKMEALGILAGGVAHDLNNMLGIIVGYSELVINTVDDSSTIRSHLLSIMEGGRRAAAIVQDLLTLARRGVSNREVLNLNRLVADFQETPEFKKLLSGSILLRINVELEPCLLTISGSPIHLGKTLFNLVLNASEAMPNGGVVTIRTANQYLDKPVQGYDEIREGEYAVLTVSDTGIGIPYSDQKHIFEPFYTKKVMGRSGTGLGLAVVWGTVQDHNGYINIESEEGKGSTFTLYFPITREKLSPKNMPVSVSEYRGIGESVLVVDDVEGQRNLASDMLKMLNYNVTSVSSGEEAVKYIEVHKVDIIVLDMIMEPGMDGLDTYKIISSIYPEQRAIIVSGFSETQRVKDAQALGAGVYVRKPYLLENLGLAIRKELAK